MAVTVDLSVDRYTKNLSFFASLRGFFRVEKSFNLVDVLQGVESCRSVS